ncbi:sugar phosphate isomerase/epimerase family protein [Maribacter halichondriae]|uniref:sugar phosphate isomerase/epimerase family protein n=1 Tax=Maribacter halichondriae TaxID=2980554 RepID=UPI002358FDB4|nr:TIM barrel protein [Maribacter sp. Hal144]
MKRRQFLTKSALGATSFGLLSPYGNALFANTLAAGMVTQPIGFQSYVLREEIGKDITGTLKKMAGMGYEYVEMCSPSGYKGPFEPLVKYSGTELKKIIEDCGMKCNSSHLTWNEMNENLEERIDWANQMGLEHFVASGGLHSETLDELKEKCAKLNTIGEKVKKAGMVAAFHNHDIEFKTKFDDKLEYDIILEELDPNLVKMQFQTQVIVLGYKGSDYFKKFPGRFISTHMQDYDAMENPKEIALGSGISDWKDFFAAADTGGLQVVYVEMESNPGTLKGSIDYLKSL